MLASSCYAYSVYISLTLLTYMYESTSVNNIYFYMYELTFFFHGTLPKKIEH